MSTPKTQPTLFDAPRPGSNMPEFTVTEISRALKKTVEDTYGLVRVRGEICECKYHSNGHIYITLKDESSNLAAVCWRGQAGKLGLKPEIGMEVICTGGLTTYAGQSKYQLVIQGMALAGIGALLKLLEDRKKKLAAEGLFDAERKRPLPFLPNVIGVITSPTGAVIRDILHRLDDRFPRHVLVWPVAVQGEAAAAQIAAALEGFNALDPQGAVPRPDLLIVARGGGSVEDLMPFNDEAVVRAAAASNIPVISAVGHETDTTLIDFAADIRAPTPTAAAELAVPVRANLIAQVNDDGFRLQQAMYRAIAVQRERLNPAARVLADPMRMIEPWLQRLDDRYERLALAGQGMLGRRKADLTGISLRLRHPRDILKLAEQKLQHGTGKLAMVVQSLLVQRQHALKTLASELGHLSPRAVLGRGYALVQKPDGHVIASSRMVEAGDAVTIEWGDGTREGRILK